MSSRNERIEPAEISQRVESLAGYEAARAKKLRLRTLWLCGFATALLLLSLHSNVLEINEFTDARRVPAQLDACMDGLLALIFIVGAALSSRGGGDLRRGVRLVQNMSIIAGLTITLCTPLYWQLTVNAFPPEELPYSPAFIRTWSGIADFCILHLIVSLMVSLSLRESLSIVLAGLCGLVISQALLVDDPLALKILKVLLFPLAATPGMLISWWRYQRFNERFRLSAVSGSFGELAMELAYARRIHEALFPPLIERGPVRVNYRYEPMRQIGGDFLFIHPLAFPPAEHSGAVTIVLIDVTGHGVPAALTVNRLHDELHRFFIDRPAGKPGELMCALNRFTNAYLAPQGVFATAICARLDPANRELRIAGGGHPPALLLRRNGQSVSLGSGAPMLGVLDPEFFDPVEASLLMEHGDRLLAFTDGANEARNPQGAMLGLEGVHAAAVGIKADQQTPGLMPKSLMDAVARHHQGRITDDTLIVEMWLGQDAGVKV